MVAFTEDGQKYTEYISQLEIALKENGIELTNKKFSKDFKPAKIRSVSVKDKLSAAKSMNSCSFIVSSLTKNPTAVTARSKIEEFKHHHR